MQIARILLPLLFVFTTFSDSAKAKEFVEPDYGFSFRIDEQKWKLAPIPVSTLGEPVVVLVDGQSPKMLFDVFVRTGTGPEQKVEEQLKSLQERLDRLASAVPGAEKLSNDVIDIAGRKAVSFRMSGVGTGLGIGGGETPTVQHWYGFPRGKDLIVFQVTASKDNFDAAFDGMQELMKSVAIDDERPANQGGRSFDDKEVGVKIAYPDLPWIRGGYELGDFVTPGYLLRLWSAPSASGKTGDAKSSYATRLAMFLQFPGKSFSPQELLDISIKGLTTRLSAQVIKQEVRTVAGMKAMWLVVEGDSESGSNLTGKGDVRTRQLWVAIPRTHGGVNNIVVFLLNAPAADFDKRLDEFEKLLETLEVAGQVQP